VAEALVQSIVGYGAYSKGVKLVTLVGVVKVEFFVGIVVFEVVWFSKVG